MVSHKWQGKYFYQILGVEPTASLEEIKSEYRWLARRFHPDQNHGDERAAKRFRDITEAYEVLAKPEERAKYDAFLASGQSTSRSTASSSPPPRREQRAPEQKPPYRNPQGAAPPRTEKSAPRSENQTQSESNSKYRDQPAPTYKFDNKESRTPSCLAASMTILGSLLLFNILVAVAMGASSSSSNVGQTSQSSQSVNGGVSSITPNQFCGFVLAQNQVFNSTQDIYAFRTQLADALDKLDDSDANLKRRSEALLSRTIRLAEAVVSDSDNYLEAQWEQYVRAYELLGAACQN